MAEVSGDAFGPLCRPVGPSLFHVSGKAGCYYRKVWQVTQLIPGPGVMTRGRVAYESDVRERPNYHDGKPRRSWEQLSYIAQWSWEKNPFPLPCAPEDTGEN